MAIKTYKKGTATKLSTNFNSTEFDCHGSGCCTSTKVDEDLVKYLQKIREHFGKPVNISSGYRCETHNKNIGGATNSRHSKGQAADIYISGVTPAEIAKYAESIGILGIGLYETDKDGHFVHVDTRTTKAFWYGQAEASRTTFGGTAIQEETTVKIDTSKVVDTAADPKVIWDFLKAQGLNDYGIAGLMGNLYAESGLKPTNLQNTFEKKLGYTDAEYTAAVDQKLYTNFVNDSAGYGLAQWTYYSRKQNMLTFHTKKGKSIGDLTTQLEFLVYELSNNYKTNVWEVLKTAKTVLEASNAVLLKFERPADQSTAVQNKRAGYGQTYYDKYATKSTTTQTQTSQGGTTKMKYSASNKPLVCMQTQSTCYKGTSKMTVKGVLWHSTGANNPNLKRYVQPSDSKPAADTYSKSKWLEVLGTNSNKNDWNHIDRQAGLNCWIGKLADGTVTTVQTMPWDYRPWGCGSGSRGSCNTGWIQFEICEDNLASKDYFEKVYKEACEITAYLCDMYDLDPKGTVSHCGTTVPVILCHADSYKLGLGSNHGDVLHWFKKYGKTMDDVRNDVAALMKAKEPAKVDPEKEPAQPTQLYRVRKSWADAKSQIGAYGNLNNAKVACDKAGSEYSVFNSGGIVVYPENRVVVSTPESSGTTTSAKLKVGDAIKLLPGATYTSGKAIPQWVFKSKLYLREIRSTTGSYVFSTQKTGAVTGVVDPKYVVAYDAQTTGSNSGAAAFTPYLVKITADVLNVRLKANTSSAITTQVKKGEVFTIVGEDGKWGKLKSGAGWIHLDYTKKL